MRILATGPESSGTNYLTRLLAAGGAEVVHRSQPEGGDWIDVEAMLDHPSSGPKGRVEAFDHAVVVIRGRLGHCRSMVRRNIEPEEGEAIRRRRAALRRLAPIIGDERVTVVTYESLASEHERRHLLWSLGLDADGAVRAPFNDENGKYYK